MTPQESGKVWCEHIEPYDGYAGFRWVETQNFVRIDYLNCPFCGKRRPEERDELDEIFNEYIPMTSSLMEMSKFKESLRAWKEKGNPMKAWAVSPEEEKPKRLSDVLKDAFYSVTPGECWTKPQAKAALEWFDKIILEEAKEFTHQSGILISAIEVPKIRQRIEKERSEF